MVFTNVPATTRCSCSTNSAIWNAASCVPATCTAPTDGRVCSSRSSCGIRARSCASTSALMLPSPCPGVYECLEVERIKYAIRLPANQVLQNRIGYLLKRPVGRPPNEVRRYYANFSYQAASWTKPRRVIAKVEWHPGELYPRVGFIVTNMSRPAERVVAFYNKRGTCEQWIKEGKGCDQLDAVVMPDLRSQRRAAPASCTFLQSRQLPATLATPEPIKDWSLTSLKEKLIKIGAKIVSHGRYVAFQMAEVAIPRQMFQEILRLIAELRPQPPPAPA